MAGTKAKNTLTECIQALKKANGNITRAAALLGCERSSLSHRISRNKKLQTAREQAEETLIDFAESELWKKIKTGHFPSIKLALTTKGRRRGWVIDKDGELSKDDIPPQPGTINYIKKSDIPDNLK